MNVANPIGFYQTVASGVDRYFLANTFSNNQIFRIDSSDKSENFENTTFTAASGTDVMDVEVPSIIGVSRSGSTMYPFYGGSVLTSYAFTTSSLPANCVGVLGGFGGTCAAIISEFFLFNSRLNSTDRTNLYNYLAAKWGL